jgi:ceramide glucosyltransferase
MNWYDVILSASLIPVIGGSVYSVVCLICVAIVRFRSSVPPQVPDGGWPAVSVLKPVHGLEKELERNLRSICLQDYPNYQVVFSVQSETDRAIPLLKQLQAEFGSDLVTVVIDQRQVGVNGKINNLIGGLAHAKHDVLVISDSDVYTGTDYLKAIVAPLGRPDVGFVCTFFKAASAESWFEKMELLTMNACFFPDTVFAYVTKTARFCIGASLAFRRSSLRRIGGLESLADYFAEDYEMGRRIWEQGKKPAVAPYVVTCTVDLKTPLQWWNHQVYWDQNSCSVRPIALFSTLILRAVPFAILFAALRFADPLGLSVLGGAVGLRLFTAAGIMEYGLKERVNLTTLLMLPVRDLIGVVSLILGLSRKTVVRRNKAFLLTKDGRLVMKEVPLCESLSSTETTSASLSR